jgi:hypothetical protein
MYDGIDESKFQCGIAIFSAAMAKILAARLKP